jgi:transcriptional regulator with XRE-family HTH domain
MRTPGTPSPDLLDLLPAEPERRGPILRFLREIRGESQRAVERALGMGRADLSAIEHGRRSAGKALTRKLLRLYRADAVQLLLIGLLLGEWPGWTNEMREEKDLEAGP